MIWVPSEREFPGPGRGRRSDNCLWVGSRAQAGMTGSDKAKLGTPWIQEGHLKWKVLASSLHPLTLSSCFSIAQMPTFSTV